MIADLETLATALYVTIDDALKTNVLFSRWRPEIGFKLELTDAELLTLSVMQALLGFTSEAHWLRHANTNLTHLFPYLPQQSGYNKRLKAALPQLVAVIRLLATDTKFWTDDVWVVDSTPVECGRSRETVKRSNLAGWAEYGYCASHSRWFWGLRLHLVCTLHGLPIAFALTGAKADERDIVLTMFDVEPWLLEARPGQLIVGDKGYAKEELERILGEDYEATLLRPARKNEKKRPGSHLLKPVRQVVESVFDTFKDQLDLERHNGKSVAGVTVRVLQRILALTAAIWHNDKTDQPVMRSLVAYDH